jgi:hypothetical protein
MPPARFAAAPAILFLLLAAAAAAGEAAEAAESVDLPALVGLSLADALDRFGAPQEVLAARGAEPWQDDVVFFYPQHLYLFFYQNRVWQARVDARYEGKFLAIGMGASRSEVLAALGAPMKELPESLVYQLEDRGYPVRLRLYFEEDRLVDAYCFRADL